ERESKVLAEHELAARDGLGKQAVNAASLDLLGNQADAKEDGNRNTNQRRCGQPEVLDDLDVLTRGQLREQDRCRDEHDGKEHEAVRDAVANRVSKHTEGNDSDSSHDVFFTTSRSSDAARTWSMKTSSSVVLRGFSDTTRTPLVARSAMSGSGLVDGDNSSENRPSPSRLALTILWRTRFSVSSAMPGTTTTQPPAWKAISSSREPAAARRPFVRIATRLQSASASLNTCELKNTVQPRSRSRKMSSRTSCRPSGSRPDIGSSRNTSSGSLMRARAIPTRGMIPFSQGRRANRRSAPMPTSSSNRVARWRPSEDE